MRLPHSTRHRVLLATASGSLALFSLLAPLTATTTFTPSFYAAFSPLVWAAFLAFLLSSLGGIATTRARRTALTFSALLIAGFAVFWELPHLLNLPFWAPPAGDMLMHYGSARYTIDTGHYWPGTVYPLLHGLLAGLSMVTGIPVAEVGSAFSLVMTVTGIAGLAALSGRLFDHPRARYVTAAAAGTLVYGKFYHNIFPWFASFLLTPLVFLLLDVEGTRRQRGAAQLGALTLAIAITLLHPMTAIVLFGMGVVYTVTETEVLERTALPSVGTPTVAWLLAIPLVHFLWFFDRGGFSRHIATIALSVFGADVGAASQASRAGASGYTLAQLIYRYVILQFGPMLLIVGAGCLVTLAVAYRLLRGEGTRGEVLAVALFGSGFVLAGALLAFNGVATGAVRINQVTILAALLLVGGALTRFSTEWPGYGPPVRAAVAVAIVLTAVIAPFTIYPETYHTTQQEFDGAAWFLDHRDIEVETHARKTTHKLEVYLQGAQPREGVTYRTWAFGGTTGSAVPAHLGYERSDTVRESLGDAYLITKEADSYWKAEPPNRYDDIVYYDQADVARLEHDTTANAVYRSGGFTLWRVGG